MDEKDILRYARKFDDDFVAVEKIGEWQGYTVYSPIRSRKGVCCAGFPLRVLVKDGKMRWTSPKESIEIVRIFGRLYIILHLLFYLS